MPEVEHDVERLVDSSPRTDWSTGQADGDCARGYEVNQSGR
ncbi:MAG: hypothetical protein OEZ34_03620 [Spirochaetia bacterium]|nr:hypothetical protein [Spirochaetia bacterium]